MTVRACGYHWWILIARCDGFALGSILAVIFADRERVEENRRLYGQRLGFGLILAFAFLMATLPFSLHLDFETMMSLGPSLTILGFNLVYFGLIGLVLCFTGHPALRILRDPRLGYLGTVSYGLYIYHPPVFLGVGRLCLWLGMGEGVWIAPLEAGRQRGGRGAVLAADRETDPLAARRPQIWRGRHGAQGAAVCGHAPSGVPMPEGESDQKRPGRRARRHGARVLLRKLPGWQESTGVRLE